MGREASTFLLSFFFLLTIFFTVWFSYTEHVDLYIYLNVSKGLWEIWGFFPVSLSVKIPMIKILTQYMKAVTVFSWGKGQ